MKRLLIACLCLMPLTWATGAQEVPPPGSSLSLRFLSIAQGKKALVDGEEATYFEQLQMGDLRAKGKLRLDNVALTMARSQLRERYAEDVRAFTPSEEAMLRDVMSRLAPKIIGKAPLMARTPFSFIKTGSCVEAGIPHTRGAHIVLSQTELDAMMRMYRWAWTSILDQMAAPLLVHEQVHVLQRAHPQRFVSLYTEILGFRHLDTVPDHPWLLEHRVANPDAQDLGWIYKINIGGKDQWIRPDLMLRKLDQPDMASDLRIVAIELKESHGNFVVALDERGQARIQDLNSIGEYQDIFPNRQENYHPNEIGADLIAGWISGHAEGNAGHALRKRIAEWGWKNLQ
ncbi:hypothetical protein H5407_12855 [Mitsuaria sp. WAJ17]|uniref:hypothetical protein n=1 Tax=Mitsuaria sp. WAJ17 TaxID=2761452 RepID=UPI001601357D|nr:hypothetical protein [Mitsuaria sp. WAJ17]MBB2486106.1 hypothetical protein [Mitsuaria sp. WAJ17]